MIRETNGTHPATVKRISGAFSYVEEKRRDSLIRSAFLNIWAGFKCRPEPRGPIDEVAQGDSTPWKYALAPMRNAVLSAVQSGDRQLVDQTLEGIRGFLREIEADVCSLIPVQESEVCLRTAAVEETVFEGAANPVQMELAANPNCPTTAEKAVLPLMRHHERLGRLLERCRRFARTSSVAVRIAR